MSIAEPVADGTHLSDAERSCIEACTEAAAIARWCAETCRGEEGMATCERRCRDVVGVASLYAEFLAQGSSLSGDLAALCVAACEDCIEACERHDAPHTERCVDALRDCAARCRDAAA